MLSWLLYLLYYICGVLGFFSFLPTAENLREYIFFLFHDSPCHRQNDISSKILYSDPDVEGVLNYRYFKCTENAHWTSMWRECYKPLDLWGHVGGSTDQWVCCVTVCMCGLQGTLLLTSNISFVWLFSLYIFCCMSAMVYLSTSMYASDTAAGNVCLNTICADGLWTLYLFQSKKQILCYFNVIFFSQCWL